MAKKKTPTKYNPAMVKRLLAQKKGQFIELPRGKAAFMRYLSGKPTRRDRRPERVGQENGMNIREACGRIIGEKLCADIIADQGIHWAVVAAMAEARTPRHDRECDVIRAWRAEQKALADVLADALKRHDNA